MVGPPGSGKTLMARAVAGEAEVPFFALTGSSFVEMFVGVGASRVRDLFADARKRAPSIIFIDEIDAIGQKRGGSIISNDEREQTLEPAAGRDGRLRLRRPGIVVMAATNRPEVLDPALLRPGPLRPRGRDPAPQPGRAGRDLEGALASEKHLGPDVDLDAVSRGTPGFSGADLANLINEAAIVAVRHDRDVISAPDIDEARDRIILGRRDGSNCPPARGEALGRGPRDGPRPRRGALRARRPCRQDHDPARRPGARGHRAAAPSTSGTCTRRATCATRSRSVSAAVPPRSSCSARPRRAPSSDLGGATELAVHMVRDWGLSPRLGPIGYGDQGPAYLGGTAAAVAAVLRGDPARHRRGGQPAPGRGRGAGPQPCSPPTATCSTPSWRALLEKETMSGHELMEIVRRTIASRAGSASQA